MLKETEANRIPFVARIARNTAFIFSSRIFDILIALVTTALIARYLGIIEFGHYAFVMAISIFLAPLIDLGFERITTREIARNKALRKKLFGSAIIARGFLTLIILIGVFVAISIYGWHEKIAKALLVSVTDQIFIATGMLALATFQAFEKMEYQFGLKFIFNLVFLVLLLVVINYDLGFIAVFAARLCANMIQSSVMMLIVFKKFLKPIFKIDFPILKFLFKEAVPLGLFTILLTASFKIDVFVLKYFRSIEDLSLFEAAHRIIMQLQLLPMSLSISLFPYFSRKAKDSKAELAQSYYNTFKFVFIVSLPFPILLSLFAEPIISILFGREFLPASIPLVILSWSISFLFLITLQSFVMTSEGRQVLNTYSAAACLVINFLLDIIWVPRYGYIGASYATLVSYACFFLLSFYFTTRSLSIPPLRKILPKPILSAGFIWLTGTLLFQNDGIIMIAIESAFIILLYFTVLFFLKTFTEDERLIMKGMIFNKNRILHERKRK